MASYCLPCDRSFVHQGALQQHLNSPVHALIYKCERHNRKFDNQQALKQHLDSPAHAPVYECDECDREFGSQQALNQHLDSPAHAPVYECNECDREFGSQQALNQHLNSPAHILEHNKRIRSFGNQEIEKLSSTSSFHAVAPPENGLVWNNWDGILWEVGYHPRDRYAPSRPPQITRGPSSYTTNAGSWNQQLTRFPDYLEPLRIGGGPSSPYATALPPVGTVIEYSLEYMGVLRSFVLSTDILRQNGHILEPLSESDLDGKKRCQGCGKTMRKFTNKKPRSSTLEGRVNKPLESLDAQRCEKPAYSKGGSSTIGAPPPIITETDEIVSTGLASVEPTSSCQPIIRCKYHDGFLNFKTWSCCGNYVSSDPCTGSESHMPRQYPEGEIESLWRFLATPNPTQYSDIRQAVAIDCEMGTAVSGDSELIRLTLIDYFSSAILVDSLVYPNVEMSHYNTRFSGVTKKDMEMARAKGTCFRGRDEARAAVWRFVGPSTLVVGHSVNNDLTAMRWIHSMVVDTWLIESIAAKATQEIEEAKSITLLTTTDATPNKDQQTPRKGRKGSGTLSLKTLAKVRLDREIQVKGNKGHDSLEDALATRDLAHWLVRNNDYRGGEGIREFEDLEII